jgi:hypothetical protein
MAEQKLSPLAVFDARIVQTPLQGLLRNMDSELARLLKQAMTSHNSEAERRLSLFDFETVGGLALFFQVLKAVP